ncbi:heavy metal translocating P-type ATPase [Paludifilum halophilum]|uniref:heavy metal translocating P-type ATPase n=1 Tax=Paludifilum halophilum TaxID=1642702 RepID=UPI001F0B3CD2|nr:heavy metal translocating P-type ATPase [Paludifilum halophilum]
MGESIKPEETAAVARNKRKGALSASRWRTEVWPRYGEGIATLFSGGLILAAWLGDGGFGGKEWILYLLAYTVGGFAKAREGVLALVRDRRLDVNLLMVVAGMGAVGIGYWMEGALLIFIFSLSGALERMAEWRSQRDLSALMAMEPAWARRVEGDREQRVPIADLRVGDRVLVKPGERIPADGVVQQGKSEVDQAAITGESVPAEKGKRNRVFAGTLNGQGFLTIKVSRLNRDSTFAGILRLVEEAQTEKPPSQRKMERFEEVYTGSVIGTAVLWILLPPLLAGVSWNESLYRGMVFLVVASPCAVVASIMPAVLSAMSKGARDGLLFKGGAEVQALAGIRAIAFDKTGTLTSGEMKVTDRITLGDYTENELLRAAASIESLSEHPVARAIVREARGQRIPLSRPNTFRSQTGFGVKAVWEGECWRIGRPCWRKGRDAYGRREEERLAGEGKTVVLISNSRGAVGLLALQDRVRPEAKKVVSRLKRWGVRVVMLTGDRRTTVEAVAEQAGIDEVRAELLPEEKVKAVKELEVACGPIAMVGDGVNDAPALAAASVGIAMGAAGSDTALETARVVLMNDDLSKAADAVALGRRTQGVIQQNLAFALAVIGLLIIANITGRMTLPVGVVGHEGSTLLVILNGLRVLR